MSSVAKFIAITLAALSGSSGVASPPDTRASASLGAAIVVDVTSHAEDATAKRLTSAVVKELSGDSRFALAAPGVRGTVNISLPSGVGWKRRLDWTEITYQARLNFAVGRSRVVTGHCWNWNLPVCAKQIANAAAQFSSN